MSEANQSAGKTINSFLREAISRKASDIHLNPQKEGMQVFLRVDGMLMELLSLPTGLSSEIISRLKVLSHLRIDEHQRSQDGRFHFEEIDIRLSIVPTYFGERAVLRLLSNTFHTENLDELGFEKEQISRIEKGLDTRGGMILCAGPTGSGKTSTLYRLLQRLLRPELSIVTIEDPVESTLPGIVQVPVRPAQGFTFASALRAILRQDPDIIMVGEIRDEETARIAVSAALTGHLLLSTLHTIDAASSLPRLLDMGIEPYLIASTIRVVIAQRLVRRLCVNCLTSKPSTALEKKKYGIGKKKYVAVGCDACYQTGYQGRTGISEVLLSDAELAEAIIAGKSAREIKEIAVKNEMKDMWGDALEKVEKGVTSLEEVLRVLSQ